MPIVTDSRGVNVWMDDAEAERDALVALREANHQLDAWDASGHRDTAAYRLAVNLTEYAGYLLDKPADEEP